MDKRCLEEDGLFNKNNTDGLKDIYYMHSSMISSFDRSHQRIYTITPTKSQNYLPYRIGNLKIELSVVLFSKVYQSVFIML